MSNQELKRLLNLADEALRQAERLAHEMDNSEAYEAIGYALGAVSCAEAASLPAHRQ